MNLLDYARKAQEELERLQRYLEDRERALNAEQARIDEFKKELENDRQKLEQRERSVDEKLAKIASYEQLVEREKSVVEKERELKSRELELMRWENRLYDIESKQERDRQDLAKAQKELSEEKANYKEKIRKEFLESLSFYQNQK